MFLSSVTPMSAGNYAYRRAIDELNGSPPDMAERREMFEYRRQGDPDETEWLDVAKSNQRRNYRRQEPMYEEE